jgi:hypothetical protein
MVRAMTTWTPSAWCWSGRSWSATTLATDVAGAQAVGIRGVLVRTGKGAEHHPDADTTEPDAIADSLAALPGLLQ